MDDSDGWTMNEWTLCHWTVFLKDGKLKIVNRRCSLQEKKNGGKCLPHYSITGYWIIDS